MPSAQTQTQLDSPKPQFQDGYRSQFRFVLERGETVSQVAEHYMRDWLRSRKGGLDTHALDQWNGQESIVLPSGASVERVDFEEERSQTAAVRYRVVDLAAEHDTDRPHDHHGADGRPHPEDAHLYRVTVTAVGDLGSAPSRNAAKKRRKAQKGGSKDFEVGFVIQVARTAEDQETAINAITPPRIVAEILEDRRVFDGATRLQGRPRLIHASDVAELVQAVEDQGRQIPLIVASSMELAADSRWNHVVKELTRLAVGTAAVYTVSSDAVEALNNALPPSLRVEPGCIRFIAPKVNLENPDLRRHPQMEPDQVAFALDEDGHPLPAAQSEVAHGPRKSLLDAPLPTSMRRPFDLLGQAERRIELARQVDNQVAIGAAEVATGETKLRKFPRRADRHRRRDGHSDDRGDSHGTDGRTNDQTGDFWHRFRTLLGGWLNKPLDHISEETVEDDLLELDRQILRERRTLEVHEAYLSDVEAKHNKLETRLAEANEDKASLEAQLEQAKSLLEHTQAQVDSLLEQLEEAGRAPAPQPEPDRNGELERLALLQEKLNADAEPIDARAEIGRALELLTQRLEPIIEDELEPRLQGIHWTRVLTESDLARGRKPGTYNAIDPQAQLRMITEPLGRWGFPFERDNNRSVSAYGQQLRGLRNRWAHGHAFEEWDAIRAHDTLHKLLALLGDEGGAAQALAMREEVQGRLRVMDDSERLSQLLESIETAKRADVIPTGTVRTLPIAGIPEEIPIDGLDTKGLAEITGVAEVSGVTAHTKLPNRLSQDAGDVLTENLDSAKPDAATLVRADASATPTIGDQRIEYEPWRKVGRGDRELLDRLNVRSVQQMVEEVAGEIVDFEGPIAMDRLLGLIGNEFGMTRLHERRRKSLMRRVRATGLVVDGDGFVWPESIDPESWAEFRPNGPDVERAIVDVSPVEIRNAARVLLTSDPSLEGEELERKVLATFGRSRMTKVTAKHLRDALAQLE